MSKATELSQSADRMAKLLVLLAVFVFVQACWARDVAEVLNDNIRAQLSSYDKFLKEPTSEKYAGDLKKLVQLTEGALKVELADEKNQILSAIPNNFSPEFNSWISFKLEEAQVNDDIRAASEFYRSLLPGHAEFEAEIKQILNTLDSLLKETNLKQKEDNFLALSNTFSANFQKFLKDTDLPNVNRRLQATSEFFQNLLNDKDLKFVKEVQDLKAKTDAALGNNVSLDDKNKVLEEVSFTANEELNEFLQKKNLEYS